jgi:hypothetical protein
MTTSQRACDSLHKSRTAPRLSLDPTWPQTTHPQTLSTARTTFCLLYHRVCLLDTLQANGGGPADVHALHVFLHHTRYPTVLAADKSPPRTADQYVWWRWRWWWWYSGGTVVVAAAAVGWLWAAFHCLLT